MFITIHYNGTNWAHQPLQYPEEAVLSLAANGGNKRDDYTKAERRRWRRRVKEAWTDGQPLDEKRLRCCAEMGFLSDVYILSPLWFDTDIVSISSVYKVCQLINTILFALPLLQHWGQWKSLTFIAVFQSQFLSATVCLVIKGTVCYPYITLFMRTRWNLVVRKATSAPFLLFPSTCVCVCAVWLCVRARAL